MQRSALFGAVVAFGFALGLGTVPVQAFDLHDKVEVHGYAHQSMLVTNSPNNNFLKADSHGSFDNNALALLFSFKATDDLTIWTQLFADSDSKFRLDWAFADYRVNDWLRVRGGQIKTPLGLLNETRDARFMHLGAIEPYIYQESAGIMFESFRGASALLEHDWAQGSFKLDLFGGEPLYFEGEEADENHYGLVGGRLLYETPIEGLSIGATVATTREKELEEGTGEWVGRTKSVVGGSLEYKYGGVQLSGEYFQLTGMEQQWYGYYAEAGYTFFEQLTPYVRYDYFTANKHDKANPVNYQEGVVVGVRYRFNQYAAIKIEDHVINGFALPQRQYADDKEAGAPDILPGAEKNWNLFAVSLNLMF